MIIITVCNHLILYPFLDLAQHVDTFVEYAEIYGCEFESTIVDDVFIDLAENHLAEQNIKKRKLTSSEDDQTDKQLH